ncbi:MAG: glycosyltransferase family 2 protein [Candidatus Aenigmarchaeota archaeon]|nr:glycosyltransferase family 2 protein [Candidatus Aenigmarchaeota archaeon]
MPHKILLILPAYNEEGKIGSLVRKAKKSIVSGIFVACDGCTDRTEEEAREAGAIVSALGKRCGVGNAIRRGIDYALEKGYDIGVIMGGDDQDDPQEISHLIKKIDEGYDFVIGSRYLPGGKTVNQNLFRFLTTKMYSAFFSVFAMKGLSDASNGFRAFRTRICKSMDLWRSDIDGYELEPVMLFEAVKNFRFAEVPVTKYYHKGKSYSKMKVFVDWWKIIRPVLWKFWEGAWGNGGKSSRRAAI